MSRASRLRFGSMFFTGLTGGATLLILALLAIILGHIFYHGIGHISWRFLTGGTGQDMFEVTTAGILPMVVGTSARVILMTIFVLPVGVVTAIYLTEYARQGSPFTRFIRGAVNTLAGVPSIVFGLFGLGFFVYFVGHHLDAVFQSDDPRPVWGKPAILWASLTLAVLTLPVVIVATEEALRAIPQGLREASLALGATRLQTILRILLPQALPGILTGAILSVSRAAGEVAPILMTGAAYSMAAYPKSLADQFLDLAYHVFILSTQSPNTNQTGPILYATVVVLLTLTFGLNIAAMAIRAQMRKKMRMIQ